MKIFLAKIKSVYDEPKSGVSCKYTLITNLYINNHFYNDFSNTFHFVSYAECF